MALKNVKYQPLTSTRSRQSLGDKAPEIFSYTYRRHRAVSIAAPQIVAGCWSASLPPTCIYRPSEPGLTLNHSPNKFSSRDFAAKDKAMAARDRTRRKRGPLAVNNGRLRNFWNRDKSPASTSTHSPSHETKVHNESEDVQPESIQEKERSLRQWSRVLHDQTGTHEPGPSSSVEPPQISVYKFTPSPFPAYGAYINASQGVHVSDGASMPLPQALRVDSLPLEGIAEMESSFGHRQQQEDNFSGSRLSTTLNLGDQTRMAALTPKGATEPQRLPKKPVRKPIHPDGNNVTPQFVHSKPLDDVINHAEIIRHGSSFQVVSDTLTAGEETTPSLGGADYQFAITPLITQREAPPVSMLNPAAFERAMGPGSPKLTKEVDNETNTVTWVSIPKTTTGLVPPVSQLPMSSPNVAQSSGIFDSPGIVHGQLAAMEPPDRPNRGHYDITKPTCSLNLVCYRSGAKSCDLQQLHCILRSKFPSSDRFQIVINANKHLVYDDEQFFREMRSLFDIHMSSFVRRWFSLKSHKAFRILAVSRCSLILWVWPFSNPLAVYTYYAASCCSVRRFRPTRNDVRVHEPRQGRKCGRLDPVGIQASTRR